VVEEFEGDTDDFASSTSAAPPPPFTPYRHDDEVGTSTATTDSE
jgi:hypothetical protein